MANALPQAAAGLPERDPIGPDEFDPSLEHLEERECATWLYEEGLGDSCPEVRLERDIWIDRRLAAIAGLDAEIRHQDEVCERRMKMLRDHFDGELAALVRRREWLERILEQEARTYPYPPRKRSAAFPFGEIGLRKGRNTIEIEDEAAALAFAKETDGLAEQVRVKEWIPKTPLQHYLEETGEIPPGVRFVPGEDRPFVRLKEVGDVS